MKSKFSPSQSAASLVACLVTGTSAMSFAEVVSVNFREDNGNPNQSLAPETVAGGGAGVGVSNWNEALGATGELTDAVDETGTPTTLDLTWSSGGTWGDGSANGDADAGIGNAQLQRGYLDDNQGSPLQPIDITVTEIPYPLYDVVVYFSTDTAGDDYGDFTVTDANGTTTTTTTETKQLWGTNPNLDDSNSVRVSELSGDLAMNFPVRIGPTRHSVSGVQIIRNGEALPDSLVLDIAPSSAGDDLFDFSWQSQANLVYDLVSSTDLSSTPDTWSVWDGRESVAGTGETLTVSGVASGEEKRFFALIARPSGG
jgi:hypothetical protein